MTRLLVVDDSPFVRKALRRALEAHPEIEIAGEAASGGEALDLVASLAPDVVTLDIAMPGVDGLETLRRLLERHPGLPVIMLSAHTRKGAAAALEALALGAADFIDKTTLNLMDVYRRGRELADRIAAVGSRAGGAGPAGIGPGRRAFRNPPISRGPNSASSAPRRVVRRRSSACSSGCLPRSPSRSPWSSTCPWGSPGPLPNDSTGCADWRSGRRRKATRSGPVGSSWLRPAGTSR